MVLSDVALQKQLGEQARRYALAEWDSTAHVEKLVSVFKSVV